jgi:hypothetical protein
VSQWLMVLEIRKSKIRCWQTQCLVRATSWFIDCHFVTVST